MCRSSRLLDLGVEGILAPMVRTVEECRAWSPPAAIRRSAPAASAHGAPRTTTATSTRTWPCANDAIFVMPQIEDIATVASWTSILDVPGIDAVAIGPNDMSGTAGVLRQLSHPTVKTAHETIVSKAAARGIPVCLGVNTPASQNKEWEAKGVRVLMVTSDIELLEVAARLPCARRKRHCKSKAGELRVNSVRHVKGGRETRSRLRTTTAGPMDPLW